VSERKDESGLKIVHMTSVHRPFDVRIFEKQCKSLAARGQDVTLVAVHDMDEVVDGVTICAMPRPASRWQRMTRTAHQVFRAARRQRADLYQIHDPELLPWARLMRCLGDRVIYDMHENVPEDVRSKTWIPALLRRPIAASVSLMERILIGRMPVMFSEDSYQHQYSWVRRGVVIRNLAKAESLPQGATPSEKPTIGYIGAVSVERGSIVTLQALDLLKQRGLDVGFECVGPASPEQHVDQMHALVSERGLQRVNLHGYLPGREGWDKISSCHVGLAVLQPEPNYIASYPTKLFEYMAMGIPVVVSDFELYRRVVEESQCGFCVDPTSPEKIADALETLIRDPESAARMGDRGREAVSKRYTWNYEMEKLVCFYEQVMTD